MKEAKIISIANHKGGVGKTTTTVSLGAVLAQKGYKVLLVDLDGQANLTTSVLKGEPASSIYQSLCNTDVPLKKYRVHTKYVLDLAPACLEMTSADLVLGSKIARESILTNILQSQKEEYDFILIDCPPSLGLLTINALVASDYVIIPLIPEHLPMNGLQMILKLFYEIKKNGLNSRISILGILLTRWEHNKVHQLMSDNLQKEVGEMLFSTRIRKNITVAKAPQEATNIVEFDPKSNGAIDYVEFANEVLSKLNK